MSMLGGAFFAPILSAGQVSPETTWLAYVAGGVLGTLAFLSIYSAVIRGFTWKRQLRILAFVGLFVATYAACGCIGFFAGWLVAGEIGATLGGLFGLLSAGFVFMVLWLYLDAESREKFFSSCQPRREHDKPSSSPGVTAVASVPERACSRSQDEIHAMAP